MSRVRPERGEHSVSGLSGFRDIPLRIVQLQVSPRVLRSPGCTHFVEGRRFSFCLAAGPQRLPLLISDSGWPVLQHWNVLTKLGHRRLLLRERFLTDTGSALLHGAIGDKREVLGEVVPVFC